ncbi:hypothetical protein CTI14_51510, partial [Methylobacterium radiotolerans]
MSAERVTATRGADIAAGMLPWHSRLGRAPEPQFRAAYGESVYQYLMTRRIERAMGAAAGRRAQRHRGLLRRRL